MEKVIPLKSENIIMAFAKYVCITNIEFHKRVATIYLLRLWID